MLIIGTTTAISANNSTSKPDGLEFLPQESFMREICQDNPECEDCAVIRDVLYLHYKNVILDKKLASVKATKPHAFYTPSKKQRDIERIQSELDNLEAHLPELSEALKSRDRLLSSLTPQDKRLQMRLINVALDNATKNEPQGPLNYIKKQA